MIGGLKAALGGRNTKSGPILPVSGAPLIGYRPDVTDHILSERSARTGDEENPDSQSCARAPFSRTSTQELGTCEGVVIDREDSLGGGAEAPTEQVRSPQRAGVPASGRSGKIAQGPQATTVPLKQGVEVRIGMTQLVIRLDLDIIGPQGLLARLGMPGQHELETGAFRVQCNGMEVHHRPPRSSSRTGSGAAARPKANAADWELPGMPQPRSDGPQQFFIGDSEAESPEKEPMPVRWQAQARAKPSPATTAHQDLGRSATGASGGRGGAAMTPASTMLLAAALAPGPDPTRDESLSSSAAAGRKAQRPQRPQRPMPAQRDEGSSQTGGAATGRGAGAPASSRTEAAVPHLVGLTGAAVGSPAAVSAPRHAGAPSHLDLDALRELEELRQKNMRLQSDLIDSLQAIEEDSCSTPGSAPSFKGSPSGSAADSGGSGKIGSTMRNLFKRHGSGRLTGLMGRGSRPTSPSSAVSSARSGRAESSTTEVAASAHKLRSASAAEPDARRGAG
mmetsp:Transcript_97629/g.280935  ORF Transcript_97629/g.280935 Transcript_97629/m.280935 type:complete len:507 (-) Transcript_97629:4-1524(-)